MKNLQQKLWLLYLRAANLPLVQRTTALSRGEVGTALEREAGQGLLEYIIAIAGVFMVATAVLAFYNAITGRYQVATTSVNQIQISAP